MTKQEKQFIKLFHEAFICYLECNGAYSSTRVCVFEEIAKQVFPRLNIELYEKVWRKDFNTNEGGNK